MTQTARWHRLAHVGEITHQLVKNNPTCATNHTSVSRLSSRSALYIAGAAHRASVTVSTKVSVGAWDVFATSEWVIISIFFTGHQTWTEITKNMPVIVAADIYQTVFICMLNVWLFKQSTFPFLRIKNTK